MTIKELYDQLDTLDFDSRAKYLGLLTKMLSGPSMSSLRDFQNKWDGDKPFEEFVKEQNKVFKMCIDLELAPFGLIVRKLQNLSVLTWDTEVV